MMSTENTLDPNRLVLCIWYLADQRGFYVDYYERFESLAQMWMQSRVPLLKQTKPVMDLLPDICGGCLYTWTATTGGRVRTACTDCWQQTWSGAYLQYDYRYKMAEILNVSEQVLESYLALALWYKKVTRSVPRPMPTQQPALGEQT